MSAGQRVARSLVIVGAALLSAQCGREERTLVASGTLEVQRPTGTVAIAMQGRLAHTAIPKGEFDQAWDIVTRASPSAESIAITLAGGTERDPSQVATLAGLVLVVPTPLSQGAVHEVGHTLSITTNILPMHWEYWGPRMLSRVDTAEIGFRVYDHYAIGGGIQNNFLATGVTGTVTVVSRRGEQVTLRLDATTRDAAGAEVRLRGDIVLSPERYTPPIS